MVDRGNVDDDQSSIIQQQVHGIMIHDGDEYKSCVLNETKLHHPVPKLSSLLCEGVLEKTGGGAKWPAPVGSRTLLPRDSRA
jgi:hypothetical protein